MLTLSHGLDDRARALIAALEAEVVAADGGRLKLEHGELAHRDPAQVRDALWWDGERLLGFAGLYAFSPPDAELAGMVAPPARRRGIGTALLTALRPIAAAERYPRLLLVTPSGHAAGAAFAAGHGAAPAHSEHFLVLGPTPSGPAPDPTLLLRRAAPQDAPALRSILSAAFGHPAGDVLPDRPGDRTMVAERDGVVVATLRLSRTGPGAGGVYGFAVQPELQGQGVGRDLLARACRLLREQGCGRVTLEVETRNDGALGLYLSTGFVREAGEDYWALTP